MGREWIDPIKNTHTLTCFFDSTMTQAWTMAVRAAISEFNKLAAKSKLGVKFVESNDAPTASGGANVNLATASGNTTFNYGGEHKFNINGKILIGHCKLIHRKGTGNEKAFIFLPREPKVGGQLIKERTAGQGVMKVMAYHELIHACGLHNSDHNPNDVFSGTPSVDTGKTPAQDRIQIQVAGKYRFMPPIIVTKETIKKV